MLIYNELYDELIELENISKEGLLKGIELNEFINKLKKLNIDNIENEIIKRKFEKYKNEIDTIWSDRKGYTGSNSLIKWKILLEEIIKSYGNIKQQYFSPESETLIIEKIKTLLTIAETSIDIIDPYMDEKILYILCLANSVAIKILTKKTMDEKIINKIKGFNQLFDDKNIKIGKCNAFHDRFYIIDKKIVYTLGTSLQKATKGTMFTPLDDIEGEKVIQDFIKYREGTIIE